MAPSTPPPPSKVELAALTIASTSWPVMSPTTTSTRPLRNDSLLTAWFVADLVEHVLASQRLGHTFRRVFGERVFRIGAGNLENTVIEHHYSEQPESHAGSDQDFIHVVNAKATCFFDPIFDEGIAQSVFGLRFGKIRAFDNETI